MSNASAFRFPPSIRPTGFTLVELIAILLLAGILASVAGPRFFNATTFSSRGYADEAAGFLRYAQKLAMARRSDITVQIDADGLALCTTATNPCTDANPWPGPQGDTPYRADVPDGVSLATSASSFTFDPRGQPSSGVTLTLTGDTVRTLTVEPETGYVY